MDEISIAIKEQTEQHNKEIIKERDINFKKKLMKLQKRIRLNLVQLLKRKIYLIVARTIYY